VRSYTALTWTLPLSSSRRMRSPLSTHRGGSPDVVVIVSSLSPRRSWCLAFHGHTFKSHSKRSISIGLACLRSCFLKDTCAPAPAPDPKSAVPGNRQSLCWLDVLFGVTGRLPRLSKPEPGPCSPETIIGSFGKGLLFYCQPNI